MATSSTVYRVLIQQIVHGSDADSSELIALLEVNAREIRLLQGDRLEAIISIPVIDPESGESILSKNDPLRWAQLLPMALRSGDLAVEVETVSKATGSEYDVVDPVAALALDAALEAVNYEHVADAAYG